ncbi:MAG: glycosyltransferase family 4 protein [Halioglobus sp.]
MKIIYYTRYESLGASSRYRSIQYFSLLENRGHTILHRPLLSNKYLVEKSNGVTSYFGILVAYTKRFLSTLFELWRFEVAIIEKELFPYLPAFLELPIYGFRTKIVYDYDDAVWHNYDAKPTKLSIFNLQGKIQKLLDRSDAVIVGSRYIEDYCRRSLANRVVRIPTVVPCAKYNTRDLSSFRDCDIVWIGSDSTSFHVLALSDVFRRLHEELSITVRLIGFSDSLKKELPEFIEFSRWTSETEIRLMASARIGIMPLEDNPFARGKCGFKLVQYMGLGLPVVASPVGENRYIVEDGVNGYLATTEDDWYVAIKKLLGNDELRSAMGTASFERFSDKYTIEGAFDSYERVLLDVCSQS